MKSIFKLSYKNIIKRPGRSVSLILLSAFLSFSISFGTLMVKSLQNGFSSLEARLGADIMVVPYEAATKKSLESIVLQGNTGYFYMDGSVLDKIKEMDGVKAASSQYYLASASSGCCDIPVEIIGFDPDTDFTITPWIKKSSKSTLSYMDAVVGNDLNAFVGDTIKLYGVDVNVTAKLDKTGTSYDTAVFTTDDTIKTLIDASLDKKLNEYKNINSGNVISCVLVNVDDGYDVEDVLNDINLHVRKVKAVRTKNMISGISDSLSGVSDAAGAMIAAVWVLSLIIMIIAFSMMINERKKEFSILRLVGATKKRLAAVVLMEGVILSLLGSFVGAILSVSFIVPFSNLLESRLNLPFLVPNAGVTALVLFLSIIISTLAGAMTSGASAYKISELETGAILRE